MRNFLNINIAVTMGFAATVFFVGVGNADAATLAKPSNNLGLVGYWSFEDATGTRATDFSGNSNMGTLTNMDPSTDWVPGKRGKALDFDGSNDYVLVPDSASLDISSSFTISAWIKTSGTANTVVLEKSGDNTTYHMHMSESVGGAPQCGVNVSNRVNGTAINNNAWRHVVCVYNDSADTLLIYIDGVYVNGVSSITATPATNSNGLTVGSRSGSFGISAWLDEMRLYSRALSATEVAALYGTGAAKLLAGTKTGLVGYWSFDEGTSTQATDFSGRGNTGTINGGAAWVEGKRGKALQFDGSNDWVSFASVPTTVTDNFTMMAWINPAALPLNAVTAVSNGFDNAVNAGNGYSFGIGNGNGSSGSNLQGANNGVAWTSPSPGYAFPLANRWYHVTLMRRNGTHVYFVNGVVVGTANSNPSTPTKFSIGASNNGSDAPVRPFQGKIDEVKIYDRALSNAEVAAAAVAGTRTMNVSQNKTGSSLDTGLVGLWSFNGQDVVGTAAYDRSGNGNTATLTDGPARAIGKVGQALSFDGVDDYVLVPHTTSLAMSGDTTVSLWVKLDGTPDQYDGLFGKNNGGLSILLDSSGYSVGVTNVAWIMQNQGTYTTGVWDHLTVTRSGNLWTLYKNGQVVNSTTLSVSISNTHDARIGQDAGSAGRFTRGHIDEVRVYNRALSASEVKQLYNLGK